MIVKITPNDGGNPPGKLADAEPHFADGPLEGLKLIGFGIWARRTGTSRNVTFPARQYSVNGERRSFALLRPVVDAAAQERLRDLILQAYAEVEEEAAATAAREGQRRRRWRTTTLRDRRRTGHPERLAHCGDARQPAGRARCLPPRRWDVAQKTGNVKSSRADPGALGVLNRRTR